MSVLVATDFSKNAHKAVRKAAQLARERNETLVALYCAETSNQDAFWRHFVETPWEIPERVEKVAQARLRENVREVVPDSEMPEQVEYVVALKAASDGILATADARQAALIVVGATGAGRVQKVLLGSTAEHVIRASSVPVLTVAPDSPLEPYQTILAPVDFSDASRASLRQAIDLSARYDASLLVLHAFVLPAAGLALLDMQAPPQTVDAYEEQKWADFEEFLADVDFGDVDYTKLLRIGSPASAIRGAVEDDDADLICMGTRGRRGFERFLLGSTATRVVRQMPCSTWTVPSPEQS